ncbi:MAG: hypothetical protein PHP01_07590 [Phycisphaerae bacterium]|nr:hypothetical protein [Phycisphaerae bacterium]
MAKKKSNLAGALFTVLVIVIIAVLAAPFFINGILKVAIEKAGSKQLGVGVSVDKVNLNIASGTITISGLAIKNPRDYEYEHILKVGTIAVKADVKSLLSDTVEVNQVDLKDTAVVIEQKGLSSNLNDILKSMPKSKKETKPAAETKTGKNLHIASVDINSIAVTAKLLPIPGKSDSVTFNIKHLHFSDIGGAKKTTLADFTGKIFTEIAAAVATQGAGIIPADVLGSVNQSLESVNKAGEEILKTGQQAGEEIEKATESLKGLFKKKEK